MIRGIRRGSRALLLGVVAAIGGSAIPATAQAAPWACDGTGYIVQFDPVNTNGNTLLQRIVRQPDDTYGLQTLGTLNGDALNAMGFRPQDGFMYAWNRDTLEIIRIEDDGAGGATFTSIGAPVGAPMTFNTITGMFLNDGSYVVFAGLTALVIDVTTTPTQVIDVLTAPAGTVIGADVAQSPVDGRIWTVTGTGVFEVILDTVNDTWTNGASLPPTGINGGAQWFRADGRLFQYDNQGQGIFAIDLSTGDQTPVGQAPPVGQLDGTACANGVLLSKDATPRNVGTGGEVTFFHTVTSRAIFANPATFVDNLPAGMSYVPGGVTVTPAFGAPNDYADTGNLTISGVLAPQQTVTIASRVRVDPGAACNLTYDNRASATLFVQGLPPATVLSDDPATPANVEDATGIDVGCVQGLTGSNPKLKLTKKANRKSARPGGEVSYTITVRNTGGATARKVRVCDRLPGDLVLVRAAGAKGSPPCWTVNRLAPGAKRTFEVIARIRFGAAGRSRNVAIAKAKNTKKSRAVSGVTIGSGGPGACSAAPSASKSC